MESNPTILTPSPGSTSPVDCASPAGRGGLLSQGVHIVDHNQRVIALAEILDQELDLVMHHADQALNSNISDDGKHGARIRFGKAFDLTEAVRKFLNKS